MIREEESVAVTNWILHDILIFTIILIVAILLESTFSKNVYEFTHKLPV